MGGRDMAAVAGHGAKTPGRFRRLFVSVALFAAGIVGLLLVLAGRLKPKVKVKVEPPHESSPRDRRAGRGGL